MAEAFLAGLIGFLIGRGVAPNDAKSIVEGLRTYLGFEPPVGLTGYALKDIPKGKTQKACVVVRGKTYDAVALEDIIKHSKISVLGKQGAYLQVAPTIESMKQIDQITKVAEVTVLKTLETINVVDAITEITNIKNVESLDLIDKITLIDNITNIGTLNLLNTVNLVKTISSITNIANVESIDLIDLITKISEITTVKKIEHIETIGKDNIVLDLLKKGSYKAFKNDLSNDNGVTTPSAPPQNRTNTTFYGKWFLRGCMGHLYVFRIYCKRTGSGTLTLGYSIAPSMGEIGEITITPSADWDWKYATLNKLWEYDSLFIYIKSCSADVSWGFDTEGDHDCLQSPDSGVTWTPLGERLFIRVEVRYGTIPITIGGIVNTIEIPHTSSGEETTGLVALPDSAETTVMTVEGAGHMDWFSINLSHSDLELKIYCDGKLAFWDNPASMNAKGIGATTPAVQLPIYNVGAGCQISSDLKFEFKRKLEFKCRNDTGAEKNATVYNTLITMLD